MGGFRTLGKSLQMSGSQGQLRHMGSVLCGVWTYTVLCITFPDAAHAQKQSCFPEPNPSRHPIFGTPAVRLDREFAGTTNSCATATHAAFGDLNGDGLPDVAATVSKQNGTLSPAYV